MEAKLDKPLLIIFDGYDELLQSSGKTYSNYINTIAEFQKNQLIASNQLVRCVITSRITLIDKAYIPEGAAVLRLCDFNEKRIDTWIDIWNSYNKEYFNENNLNEFYLPKDEKISDLAHQPLLLMMLALYDSTDNNLAKQKNLTQTQLYDNLIRDFIKREKNKDEEFKNKQISAQNKELSEEMIRIGIAAIGMYNRGIYHITSKDLNLDINFYSGTCQLISSKYSLEDGLTEAEALLGSFFFMHKSLSIERDNGKKIENTAYEFLHNTFGEFLTSDFILLNIYNAVEEISFRMNNNRTICWNDIFVDSWYASLVYTPLFSKPVVVKMLKERSCELFKNKQIDKENVISAADLIVNRELERIMEGDIFNSINKLIGIRENVYPKQSLLVHIAIYSINLLIIRNVLTNESASIELLDSLGKDTLDKLIEIWKYAFDDNDLLSLSHLFSLHKEENNKQNYIVVSYTPNENGFKNNDNRLPNLYDISYSIDDRVIKSFTGCLIADIRHKEEVLAAMESCHLDIKSNYLLMSIINCIFRQEDSIDLKCLLNEFLETSIKENNYAFLYVYCLLLEYFLNNNYFHSNKDYSFVIGSINTLCDTLYNDFYRRYQLSHLSPLEYYINRVLLNDKIKKPLSAYFKSGREVRTIIRNFTLYALNSIEAINEYFNCFDNDEKYDICKRVTYDFSEKLHNRHYDDFQMDYTYHNDLNFVNEAIKFCNNALCTFGEINSLKPLISYLEDVDFSSIISNSKQIEYKKSLYEIISNSIHFLYLVSICIHQKIMIPMESIHKLIKRLYCLNLSHLYDYSENTIFELLRFFNECEIGELTDFWSVEKQLLGFINSKQQNISIRVVKELIKFGQLYSSREIIKIGNELLKD